MESLIIGDYNQTRQIITSYDKVITRYDKVRVIVTLILPDSEYLCTRKLYNQK